MAAVSLDESIFRLFSKYRFVKLLAELDTAATRPHSCRSKHSSDFPKSGHSAGRVTGAEHELCGVVARAENRQVTRLRLAAACSVGMTVPAGEAELECIMLDPVPPDPRAGSVESLR
ncbi:MAG TPA: hypothetical protein VLG14_05095 [Sphingomonas sp.]|nr:hypothetical protein [Sphingomonas sp.]